MKGFETIEEPTNGTSNEAVKPDLITIPNKGTKMQQAPASNVSKALDIVGDNFESIVGLATEIVNLRKMKIQTKATLQIMESKRRDLEQETESYVRKLKAETNSTLDIMDKNTANLKVISVMMNDYNKQSNPSIPSDDFKSLIESILEKVMK